MWFIIGIVLGALLLGLFMLLRNKNFMLNWYEWLLGLAGAVLLLLTIQNFAGSRVELEMQAAWMFVLILILPALILLAVAWQLASRRYKAS